MGLGKIAKGVSNFFGGKSGPGNPFGAPDLTFLKDTKAFDYLKDPNRYNFLLDAPTNPYTSTLPESGMSFLDAYRPPRRDVGERYFRDYATAINAPSSVDAVNASLDSDLMKQLLEGIDTDTKQNVGSLKMDFADRGLSGPGMLSDIEATGLAQAYGDANKNKSAVRTNFALKGLEREKAKEEALRTAYGARYGVGAGRATQERDIAAKGALSDTAAYNELLKTQAQLGDTAAERELQGKELFANLSAEDQQLFAKLLTERDLGRAGIQRDLFNAGADRQLQGRRPGVTDYFARSFGEGLGQKAAGGSADLLKALLAGGGG